MEYLGGTEEVVALGLAHHAVRPVAQQLVLQQLDYAEAEAIGAAFGHLSVFGGSAQITVGGGSGLINSVPGESPAVLTLLKSNQRFWSNQVKCLR